MLLYLADFTLQEQAEDNLTVAFLAWYYRSYIQWPLSQSNPWNCTMIQFLIIKDSLYNTLQASRQLQA